MANLLHQNLPDFTPC